MYIAATVAAVHTKKPKIGTFVADPYSTHPILTAVSISTLDEISNSRAILGIGAGGTGFSEMGLKRKKPAKAIREAIFVLKELMKGLEVDFQGEIIQLRKGRLNFQPVSEVPIVVATRGDLVLQVAGEIADGIMIASHAEPTGIKHAISQIAIGARKSNRKLNDLNIILRIDTCISNDRHAAIEAVKPMVGILLWTSFPDRNFLKRVDLIVPDELERIIAKRDYNLMASYTHLIPDSFVEKLCWAGTPDEVIQKG